MEEVLIGGIRYIPDTTDRTPQVGVAVTTHNRRAIAEKTVAHIRDNTPDALVVVVDDASTEPFPGADYRFTTQAGIARAKNKCVELLMAAGCEHLFLFDDDTWPTTPDWWRRYAEHPEPHFCYLFKDPGRNGKPQSTPATLYDDGEAYAYSHPRGCMLYLHRSVVDRVGGLRPEFQVWGHEHVEYSRRIFNAGLTSMPYQDVHTAAPVIYSMDEHRHEHPQFERSVPNVERRAELARNAELLEANRDSADYVEYRELPNLVVTTLLTRHVDPQRKRRMTSDISMVSAWRSSIRDATPVILADELAGDTVTPTGVGINNPYLQRWWSVHTYLRAHPARWVFVTDGTDVEMLQPPWPAMRPRVLYIGDEQTTVGSGWLHKNHPAHRDWCEANAGRQLLNAGVIGGDHATVLAFCHAIIRELTRCLEAGADIGVGDMAAFNKTANEWPGETIHGPQVTTVFKAEERNPWSWFRHK